MLGHKDWVRDVAWAPSLGLPMNTIASASQDGKVFIWSEDAPGVWEPTPLPDFQVGFMLLIGKEQSICASCKC